MVIVFSATSVEVDSNTVHQRAKLIWVQPVDNICICLIFDMRVQVADMSVSENLLRKIFGNYSSLQDVQIKISREVRSRGEYWSKLFHYTRMESIVLWIYLTFPFIESLTITPPLRIG